jgi:HSP20 family protein
MTLARINSNLIPSVFDRMFDERGLADWAAYGASPLRPAVNIKEDGNGYFIELAAPGLKKENFKVSVEHDNLQISAEHIDEATEESTGYTRREFSHQSFKRSFSLPQGSVEHDAIGAEYRDGILYVSLPKKEEVKPKPPRAIEIR